jgi:hypothetical protein
MGGWIGRQLPQIEGRITLNKVYAFRDQLQPVCYSSQVGYWASPLVIGAVRAWLLPRPGTEDHGGCPNDAHVGRRPGGGGPGRR